jgi:hypothetical protein
MVNTCEGGVDMFTIPRLAQQLGVYAIKHVPTGTCYVGASRQLELRLAMHHADLTRGKHRHRQLQADWDTDGPGAFTVSVLDYVDATPELFAAEQQWEKTLPRLYNPLEQPRTVWRARVAPVRIRATVARIKTLPDADSDPPLVSMDVR